MILPLCFRCQEYNFYFFFNSVKIKFVLILENNFKENKICHLLLNFTLDKMRYKIKVLTNHRKLFMLIAFISIQPGWKIDEPMMEIFHQCLPTLDKLHTIK